MRALRIGVLLVCAWVLWSQDEARDSSGYPFVWKPIAKYATAEQCRSALRLKTERVSRVAGVANPPVGLQVWHAAPKHVRPDFTLWYGCHAADYDPYERR